MLQRKYLIFFTFLLLCLTGYTIPYTFSERISWHAIQKFEVQEGVFIERISFEGAYYSDIESLPQFVRLFPIHTESAIVNVFLTNTTFVPATIEETEILLKSANPGTKINVQGSIVVSRKEPFLRVEILPVKWNAGKKIFEKLLSFDIVAEVEDIPAPAFRELTSTSNSVLSSGDWFKVKVDKSGMFKITYGELKTMGFDVSANPRRFAVFGNGGGVLPEKNTDFRYDDLVENPIVVVGQADGSFDEGDYILFYGEGPVVWKYNKLTDRFYHQNNYYDDYSYYFITILGKDGKRIEEAEPPEGPFDLQVEDFDDYAYHEIDEINLAGSGRVWYGETFDFENTYEFTFSFPNLITLSGTGYYKGNFGARAFEPSSFSVYLNNVLLKTVGMPKVSSSNRYQIAQKQETEFPFTPKNEQLTVKLVYQRSSSSATGYLDYIDLNVRRNLVMAGNQMAFRKKINAQDYSVARYILGNANAGITVWDITEAVNPKKMKTQPSSGKLIFDAPADTLRQFIAFDGQAFFQTEFVAKIENQNLHSVKNVEYLVISHPDFLTEAKRLAEFHRAQDGMSYFVTTPEHIYNEYASGSQDVTAIRDFIKGLYDHSDAGKEVKYVLLFGDASYDYKDRMSDNTNFVPCWESIESLNIVNSIASDDYFGYLDDGEGISSTDKVDVGIGRFVVGTPEEAAMAVDKCIHYATNTDVVMEPWRNIITFLADDEDANRHLKDAEILSGFLTDNHPVYNIDKIYLDAYQQISTPSGQRAPLVNQAVFDRIEQGTMIFNYSGHGGEIGLGHERFLTISDINSWKNYDKLAVFITATCEFSRYDDPTRVSAGELVFLNDKGGGIALFSTSRATYASANLALNLAIFKNNMFDKIDGEYPRFGDIVRNSKTLGGSNDKKFLLLGDPALRMAYTEHTAKTVKINSNIIVEDSPDTLRALSMVRIEGVVTDDKGDILSDFNGTLFPRVLDKAAQIRTLKTDPGSIVTDFYLYKNLLFNGKTSIDNGSFEFEFMMPKDIAYKYGFGRISYYLKDEVTDGNGYYQNFIIGGVDDNAQEDNAGPEITMFMNDTTFLPGGRTDENPLLLAYIEDESGINTTGNGIGHDITAVIDEDQNLSFNLNTYYESEKNSFNKGTVNYPFKDLEDGEHVLSLKVWDVYNNSSIAYLNFLVTHTEDLVIENLMNYPNPFMSETSFVFDHNQSGQELDVSIQVFNSAGMLVRTLESRITSESYKSPPIKWDARTDGGSVIGNGFYVYRLIVRRQDGSTAEARSKLVFVKR
ncbi:MAG: type IX secretion system sortase PorU [Bacteroidales bacterium]|nr:type IX secretion system sortase PorU [Bacteroidales bacterium]